jgi:hypothetical protein
MAGELYVRPPNVIVATAVQRCTRGDWGESDHMWADHLTWLSVYNKMDYARLHGTTLHMKAIWASSPLATTTRMHLYGCLDAMPALGQQNYLGHLHPVLHDMAILGRGGKH